MYSIYFFYNEVREKAYDSIFNTVSSRISLCFGAKIVYPVLSMVRVLHLQKRGGQPLDRCFVN